jgi:hypothetical protein
MSTTYEFPTPLHSLANQHYGHSAPETVDNVNFILARIDDEKLDHLYNTYSNATQFTCEAQLKAQWAEWYTECEEHLSGLHADILIFLLNMLGCQKAKEKRARKLKRGNV